MIMLNKQLLLLL